MYISFVGLEEDDVATAIPRIKCASVDGSQNELPLLDNGVDNFPCQVFT